MSIERFRGDYYFLSNMFPLDRPQGIRTPGGFLVPTVENIYKAARFVIAEDQAKVLTAPNGFAAKNVADRLEASGMEQRANWSKLKLAAMRACVALKFGQNPDLAARLVETGDEELIEGMKGEHYSFWGVAPIGSRNGDNWLGKILMDTRAGLVDTRDQKGLHPEVLLTTDMALKPEGINATPDHYLGELIVAQQTN